MNSRNDIDARPIKAGDLIHFLGNLTFAQSLVRPLSGVITRRGDELIVDDEMIEATTDSLGHTFFDLVDNEAAQIERWGERKLARGPADPSLKSPTSAHRNGTTSALLL